MFQSGATLLTVMLALTGPAEERLAQQGNSGPRAGTAQATSCLVTLIEDARVSAREEGVLLELEAREGLEVDEGTLLGHIDDTKAKMELAIAQHEKDKAQATAENDVNVEFAEKSAKVSEYDYRQAIEANRRKAGTIPHSEELKRLFAWERDKLRIKQSQFEMHLAELDFQVKSAQLEAAQENVARRQLIAPFDGEILEVFHHRGEWVTPGDPIFRIARMNRLRVQGWLKADEHNAGDVANRPVTIRARLAQGDVEFNGKVVFADKFVQAGREFKVWAEVENRKDAGDQWLLRPGLPAEMTVDLAPRTGAASSLTLPDDEPATLVR